ncbi:MAG: hypothetical protein ACI4R8_01100 [Candidatus Caccovivens sp.]
MDFSNACSCMNNEAQITGTIAALSSLDSQILETKQINSEINNLNVVTGSYVGSESEDIIVEVDEKYRTISAKLQTIQYESKLNFPNVGSPNLTYIDISENASYRWDAETLKYVCVGRDYSDIGIISGGNA